MLAWRRRLARGLSLNVARLRGVRSAQRKRAGPVPALEVFRRVARDHQVHVMDATSGASGVTIRGFGIFREFGGAVHGSTHTPASSMS